MSIWSEGGRALRERFPTFGDYLRERVWNNDPELRDAFGNVVDRFLRYVDAEARGIARLPRPSPGVVRLSEEETAAAKRATGARRD